MAYATSGIFPPVICVKQPVNITSWLIPTALQELSLTCNHTVIFNWADSPNPSVLNSPLELEMIATFAAAIVYGVVFSLYVICLQALSDGRRKYSMKRRWLLRIYITLMSLLSTASLIGNILSSMHDIFNTLYANPNFVEVAQGNTVTSAFAPFVVFPLTIWGADVLMLWRCLALYQGTTRILQAIVIAVLITLFLSSSAFCVISISMFLNTSKGSAVGTQWMILLIVSASGAINVCLSTLIILRIRYHQSYIRKALGAAHGSLYTRITVMCVESCSLIVVFELAYLIFIFQADSVVVNFTHFPSFLLPHICVISPLLIVYRVAGGTETATTANATDVVNGVLSRIEQRMSFRSLTSTNAIA